MTDPDRTDDSRLPRDDRPDAGLTEPTREARGNPDSRTDPLEAPPAEEEAAKLGDFA